MDSENESNDESGNAANEPNSGRPVVREPAQLVGSEPAQTDDAAASPPGSERSQAANQVTEPAPEEVGIVTLIELAIENLGET